MARIMRLIYIKFQGACDGRRTGERTRDSKSAVIFHLSTGSRGGSGATRRERGSDPSIDKR